jgi:hypothetical protein
MAKKLKKSKKRAVTAKKHTEKRKIVKKAKKGTPKKSTKKAASKKSAAQKPVGVVTHFYTHIQVAIVKFNKKISVGAKLHYKGATTDFAEGVKSMQYNHEEIKAAPKGKQIGIKVKKRVREGDAVYLAE